MKNVLITRPHNQAQKLVKSLQEKGFGYFIEPLFVVKKFAVNFDLIALDQVGGIILTSQNATDGVLEFLEKFNIDKKIKIFAVGEKTAETLIGRGYDNIIFSDEEDGLPRFARNDGGEGGVFIDNDDVGEISPPSLRAKRGNPSAEKLFTKIISDQKPSAKKLLYFCGNFITLDFAQELAKLDIKVQNIVCYEVVMNQNFSAELLAKVKNTKFDYVLLYSQNSAKNFFSLAKKHNLLEYFQSSQIVCLSEKILLLAQQLGFKNSTILNRFYE